MISNGNAGHVSIRIKDIFDMFDLGSVYKQYEHELRALRKEYEAVSDYGNILILGIKPEKVKKSVYLTSSGGPKELMDIPGIGKTDDIMDILNYLDEHLEDVVEFALVNTFDEDGGLHSKDMKIIPLDPADYDEESHAKKVACDKKRDELFARIERDVRAVVNS